ncbi:hypothetical protein [Olleya sp. HaHaR_3_96]|uniref:hypothetical protein n=1 Tax=Olleya sp. HaHaR_3_96 TaxID=2745560 RepID=UPI001C4F623C|nr:hypothetical protein [Olleya sp. HaHaR_3_96]QXP61161.1 hypothetical protein H0I26_05895 [Olleya sp. HaHaR_3_96]
MKTTLKFLSVFLILISLFSCQNEPIGGLNINAEDTIAVHSELYNNLARIADDPEEELPVTCVDFNYPITMYTFDEELQLLATTLIRNDALFLTYLNNLEDNFSISISYPITTQLDDGTIFTINNNEELQDNVDACIREVEASEAESALELISNCVWKIGYTRGTENIYLGAVFNEDDGSITFTNGDDLFFGSWTVLFIEGDMNINISLNNGGVAGSYFNFDWKVNFIDQNSLQLTNGEKTFVIHQYCDNDFALCHNFAFEECELEDTPGVAEFTFDNYAFCITNILQIDSSNTNLVYFETEEDAENNTNAIASDQVYLNTSQFQNVYIRVESLTDDTFYIITILIRAQSC